MTFTETYCCVCLFLGQLQSVTRVPNTHNWPASLTLRRWTETILKKLAMDDQ